MAGRKIQKDILEIVIAFAAAWLFYQGLAFATGTSMPLVSVVSASMEPVLHRGDLIFVVNPSDIQVGDIGIYRRNCELRDIMLNLCASQGSYVDIIHRVHEERQDGFIFKGDNNPCVDTISGSCSGDPLIVKKEQIQGKVVLAVPLLGYPRLILYTFGI